MDARNKSGHDETAQHRSFPRKRESSIHRRPHYNDRYYWMPACAGMTPWHFHTLVIPAQAGLPDDSQPLLGNSSFGSVFL
jgi:hypothetical protein